MGVATDHEDLPLVFPSLFHVRPEIFFCFQSYTYNLYFRPKRLTRASWQTIPLTQQIAKGKALGTRLPLTFVADNKRKLEKVLVIRVESSQLFSVNRQEQLLDQSGILLYYRNRYRISDQMFKDAILSFQKVMSLV